MIQVVTMPLAAVLLTAACPFDAAAQSSRDYIYIVGSSTVYPFSTVVAERFGRGSRFRTPKVESTGSGGGLKLFCDGVGVDYPDIVNASRRITRSEVARCLDNGVQDIVEVRFGYDGIIVANAVGAAELAVSRHELYLAIARWVPTGSDGQVAENPHDRWSDIDSRLPDQPIDIYGPPPTSGTRDAFVELVLEAGCREVEWVSALAAPDPAQFSRLCRTVREDGRYIDAGENDNVIVQKLQSNPNAFGIIGFSFVDQNSETLKGAIVDGVAPTFANIASLEYPVSRPLFFYVKKAHVPVIPGLREFLAEFTSERAWGGDGYLAYRGLVPLPDDERRDVADRVAELDALTIARE